VSPVCSINFTPMSGTFLQLSRATAARALFHAMPFGCYWQCKTIGRDPVRGGSISFV
jgi:hypothetical protein